MYTVRYETKFGVSVVNTLQNYSSLFRKFPNELSQWQRNLLMKKLCFGSTHPVKGLNSVTGFQCLCPPPPFNITKRKQKRCEIYRTIHIALLSLLNYVKASSSKHWRIQRRVTGNLTGICWPNSENISPININFTLGPLFVFRSLRHVTQ
jgi:hypothetical protein